MTVCPAALAEPDDVAPEPEVLDEPLPELQAARRVTAANAARAVVVAPERPVRSTGCNGAAAGRLRNLIPNLLMALSGSRRASVRAARKYLECRVPGK